MDSYFKIKEENCIFKNSDRYFFKILSRNKIIEGKIAGFNSKKKKFLVFHCLIWRRNFETRVEKGEKFFSMKTKLKLKTLVHL